MTSVTPTIQVLLDDGTGTYPTDITSRVSRSAGIGVSGHGRTDEFSAATAGSFTCTLNNNDAHLSNGTIPLTPGQGIRYKQTFGATTVNRFTGRISEAPLGFTPSGTGSTVAVTAVDPLSSLSRRPLRSMLEQEFLLDTPTAYYTLGEAEGSTSGGDTSGNGNPSLATVGNGSALAFGATGPPGALGAVSFAGGQFLRTDQTGAFISAGASWSLECWFSATTSGNYMLADDNSQVQVVLGDLGGGNATLIGSIGGTSAVNIFPWDTIIHQCVLTYDGTTLRLYLDGSLVNSVASSATNTNSTQFALGASTAGTSKLSGLMSNFAIFPAALSAGRVLAHYQVAEGLNETTAARFTRIASYVGMTTSTPTNSGQLVGTQDISGSFALDALQAVATSEGGVMFANGTGTLVMQGRYYRGQNVAADLTMHAKDVDVGTTVTLDDQQIVNQETVNREGGATQTYPTDLSLGTADRYPQSLDLIVAADIDALSRARWDVAKHSTAVPRIGSAKINLLTSSQAEQIIAAEIGDRWAFSGMPTQQWTGAGDLSVEGWAETLTVSASGAEWSITFNLLPWSLFQVAIWDDTNSLWDSALWGY